MNSISGRLGDDHRSVRRRRCSFSSHCRSGESAQSAVRASAKINCASPSNRRKTAIEAQYDAYKAGAITEAEAKARAKSILYAVRFNGSGYIFAYDADVNVVVVGTRPEMEGKNLKDTKDSDGLYYAREFVKSPAKQGQGLRNL